MYQVNFPTIGTAHDCPMRTIEEAERIARNSGYVSVVIDAQTKMAVATFDPRANSFMVFQE